MTAATVIEPGRLSLAEEGFEYARARIGARLAWRPTVAAWQRLQAARGLGAWIAVARAAAFAPYVSGVAATDALDAIEAAFRAQWRQRVDELAHWSPPAWQPALRWTAALHDLPMQVHVQHGGAAPDWLARDDDLSNAAAERRAGARHAQAGSSAPVEHREVKSKQAAASAGALSAPLAAWVDRWRRLWPADRGAAALDRWAAQRGGELHRLAQAEDVDGAASRLAARLLADVRGSSARAPCVAPFAFLALLALDLRTLRGSAVQAWWAQEGCA